MQLKFLLFVLTSAAFLPEFFNEFLIHTHKNFLNQILESRKLLIIANYLSPMSALVISPLIPFRNYQSFQTLISPANAIVMNFLLQSHLSLRKKLNKITADSVQAIIHNDALIEFILILPKAFKEQELRDICKCPQVRKNHFGDFPHFLLAFFPDSLPTLKWVLIHSTILEYAKSSSKSKDLVLCDDLILICGSIPQQLPALIRNYIRLLALYEYIQEVLPVCGESQQFKSLESIRKRLAGQFSESVDYLGPLNEEKYLTALVLISAQLCTLTLILGPMEAFQIKGFFDNVERLLQFIAPSMLNFTGSVFKSLNVAQS